ncbi:MAG: aminopeptidase N [Bdellovibrionales bacterium]
MAKNKEIYLKDYTPPAFLVDRVRLDVDIGAPDACVTAQLTLRRNPQARDRRAPLFLNGKDQKLLAVTLNGRRLSPKEYRLDAHGLTIARMPDKAEVDIVSTHNPYKNTALSGLYASGTMLSTQCEAEGFRRITYYPDRPDVMARFRVTIHADRKTFPALLSNGNLIEAGPEPKGRHFAVWEDPFPKPCYLFALVAGKLDKVSSHFVTKSGRHVRLEIYVEPGKTRETGFAMAALKKSMRWDERRFGLEYDLDRFMIVATPFFNMGAMENKGLNIFNDSCALGRPETATDSTIAFIERVVGHEYFHNWTGDRITCRDWFQLSLKEGLTVFREQEFCGDMHSAAVERIGNVRALRRAQFTEDAGPMAHPVRPDRYQAIDNFYTATVYEKGAEVVRMIQTLVGRKGFDKGMALYIKRHDGQAVTCDDFVKAMADANKIDLTQFMLWYSQAGTPVLKVDSRYDARREELKLTVAQFCPSTSARKQKRPMHIPLALGLLDLRGRELIGTRILQIKKSKQDFLFRNVKEKPCLSLLRDFSAPVRLVYPYTDDELLFLLAHDSDPFNRWEAAQKLFMKYLQQLVASRQAVLPAEVAKLFASLSSLLRDTRADAAFKALTMALPSEAEIGLALRAEGKFIDPDLVFAMRKTFILAAARHLRRDLESIYARLKNLDPRAVDGVSMGKRGLKNLCLSYLGADENKTVLAEALRQVTQSKNMTDQVAALAVLADTGSPLRPRALAHFEKRWKGQPLIMDKWLAVHAGAKRSDVLATVKRLMKHPTFDIKNPNRVSALIGAFTGNSCGFHAPDGSGYGFVGEMIARIDAMNPQSAAGLAKAFARWRDFEPRRRALMQNELKKLVARKGLSPNCHEIIGKSLA